METKTINFKSRAKAISVLTILLMVILLSLIKVSSAPTMNSVFHDQGDVYISSIEPLSTDDVTIRLRTAAETGLIVILKYFDSSNSSWTSVTMTYEYTDATGYYYFWKGIIPASSSIKRYRFSVKKDGVTNWYDAQGIHSSQPSTTNRTYDFWVQPGFSTPSWTKGTVWYSLMPDSFYNADLRNDTRAGRAKAFFGTPVVDTGWGNKHLGGSDWFGGDLKGVSTKIDSYLKNELGVNSLYFNPIWESTHNAGYGQDDYSTVNPVLGTNEELKTLINTAHSSNLKVMLDGVFQYHLSAGKWFNQNGYYPILGAFQSQSSLYYPRFTFSSWPNTYNSNWGAAILNYDNTDVRKDIYQNSDSAMQMYVKAPYNADGWRLDVGNTLQGTTLDEHTIMKDMRPYLKGANSDAVLMSEHIGVESDLNDYTLDARWNYPLNDSFRAWSKLTKNQSSFSNDLLDTTLKYPRPVALSSYNFLTTHDYTRFFSEVNSDVGIMNIAQIVQMTFVGSPSIYFGDEYGEKGINSAGVSNAAPSSFNSFDWNKSDWNYRIYNMYKSLNALRNKYSTLKTGVYKKLITNDTNKIFAFARWDSNAKIITITNQNSTTQNVTVSPRDMSVTDGTTMTDWLTGRTFTVTGGNIIVPVWAKSGAILIAGTDSSDFRNEYEARDIGNVPTVGKTIITTQNSYEVTGSGSIGGNNDSFQYNFSKGYDDFNSYARVDYIDYYNPNSKAAVMIRQDTNTNSKYYSVYTTQSGEMGISYRTTSGGTATTISLETVSSWPVWILAQRTGNTFKAYYATDLSGTNGTWNYISGSSVEIQMNNEILQGMASCSTDNTLSKAVFTCPTYTKFNTSKLDDFNKTVADSMFSVINENSTKYNISNGKLNLETSSLGENYFVADAPFGKDWTAKVKIIFNPAINGQEGDLVSMQDTSNYVKVCRIRDNGITKLGFGTVIGGYIEYNALITDPSPTSDIYLQLQRTGSRYSALYSYDGIVWSELGTNELMNFSKTQVGVTAKSIGTTSIIVSFDYFSFGNSINGENYYNSGEVQNRCNTAFSNTSSVVYGGNWVFGTGNWSYVEGGFGQSSITEPATNMNYANKAFDDFYFETSIKFNSTNGWGGVSFRRINFAGNYNDSGYLVNITSNGTLKLLRTGTILSQVSTGLDPSTSVIRIQIKTKGTNIKVFVNNNSIPSIDINDSYYAAGYISLNTSLNAVEFKNTNIMFSGFNWTPTIGNWQEVTGGIRQLDSQNSFPSLITLTAKTFKNLAVQSDIYFNSTVDNTSFGGILVHGDMGKDYRESGIFVYIRKNGNAGIMKNGVVVVEKATGLSMSNSVNMNVVVFNNDYKVFFNNSSVALIEYFNDEYPSGTVSLVTSQSDVSFTNVIVQGMGGEYASNLAKAAVISTSSSIETSGFYTSQLNDGNNQTSWSSVGYTDNENHTEYVILDLGVQKGFNRIDLYQRSDIQGAGFPKDLTISSSSDNINWMNNVVKQNYLTNGKVVQVFILDAPITARYIKITATKLNYIESDSYRFQLSEIAIYNYLKISAQNNIINTSSPWYSKNYSQIYYINGKVTSPSTSWSFGYFNMPSITKTQQYQYSGNIKINSTGHIRLIFKRTDSTEQVCMFTINPNTTSTSIWFLTENIDGLGQAIRDSREIEAFTIGSTISYNILIDGTSAKIFINGSMRLEVSLSAQAQGLDTKLGAVSGAAYELSNLVVKAGDYSFNNYAINTDMMVQGGNGGEAQGLVTTSSSVDSFNKVFFSGLVKFDNIYSKGWDGARFIIKNDGNNNRVFFTITNPVAPFGWYLEQFGSNQIIKNTFSIPATFTTEFANRAVTYKIEVNKAASINGNDLVSMYLNGIMVADNIELSAVASGLPTSFGVVASSCNLTLSNIAVSKYETKYIENGKTYYIKNNGQKATNEVAVVNGVKQYFNANGEQALIATFDYTVSTENKITGLSKLMDTTTFKAKIHAANIFTVRLLDKNGVELATGAYVGTGITVQLVYGNNEIFSTYQAILKGDLDSNGDIGLNDLAIIRDYLLESGSLDDNSKLAGDLYGESNITLNSLVGMMAYISEAGVINQ